MIDKTAELVIANHRQGKPVIQLKDLPPKESLSYRVAPLLVENQPTLLYSTAWEGRASLCSVSTLPAWCLRVIPWAVLSPSPGRS